MYDKIANNIAYSIFRYLHSIKVVRLSLSHNFFSIRENQVIKTIAWPRPYVTDTDNKGLTSTIITGDSGDRENHTRKWGNNS